jgi:hypothetical protein
VTGTVALFKSSYVHRRSLALACVGAKARDAKIMGLERPFSGFLMPVNRRPVDNLWKSLGLAGGLETQDVVFSRCKNKTDSKSKYIP